MAKLPSGVAAVLANMAGGKVFLTSDALSARQRATAAVVARYKAIGGDAAVIVRTEELSQNPDRTGLRSH